MSKLTVEKVPSVQHVAPQQAQKTAIWVLIFTNSRFLTHQVPLPKGGGFFLRSSEWGKNSTRCDHRAVLTFHVEALIERCAIAQQWELILSSNVIALQEAKGLVTPEGRNHGRQREG